MVTNKNFFFVAAFFLLLAGRLAIAGTGYLEDTDELIYIWIHAHFAAFGHLTTWAQCVNDVQGQPTEIIIRLLEYISVLPIAAAMGKSMVHPDTLYLIGLYNIIVSLLIVYVFFRILLKLQFKFELALTGAILLGTLFNYNMYTRHILPYDSALLLQLIALNLLLRKNLTTGSILSAGFLSALGLNNYMGSFMFIFINGGYTVLANYRNLQIALKKSLLFILPFILLFLCFEGFSRIVGKSYLHFLTHYYGTVNSGASFDEGLIYVFLYFYMVEKWWGLLLLMGFFTGSYLLFKKSDYRETKLVISLGIIAYIIYGGYVYFFHRMIFVGRVLHMYYPFIVIGALAFLQQQKLWKTEHIIAAIVFFAVVNYVFVIKDFNRIGYPRNSIYKYGLFEQKGRISFNYYEEMLSPIHYSDHATWLIDSTGPTKLSTGHYTLGNFCFLVDVPDSLYKNYTPRQKSDNDSLVFEQLHFESHPAYTMEFDTRFGRNFYLEKKFKISIIKARLP